MRFDWLVTLSDLVFHRILAGARACPPLARPTAQQGHVQREHLFTFLSPFYFKIVLLIRDSTCSPTIYFKSTSSLPTAVPVLVPVLMATYLKVQ